MVLVGVEDFVVFVVVFIDVGVVSVFFWWLLFVYYHVLNSFSHGCWRLWWLLLVVGVLVFVVDVFIDRGGSCG